ncbi:hypothetical protein D3C87_1833510 [compost metagenome]
MKVSAHNAICRSCKLADKTVVADRKDECARAVFAHVPVHVTRIGSACGGKVVAGEVEHAEITCCAFGQDHARLRASASGDEVMVAEKGHLGTTENGGVPLAAFLGLGKMPDEKQGRRYCHANPSFFG